MERKIKLQMKKKCVWVCVWGEIEPAAFGIGRGEIVHPMFTRSSSRWEKGKSEQTQTHLFEDTRKAKHPSLHPSSASELIQRH